MILKIPLLNIPMIINEEDGMVYEVLNAGFYTNDAVGMISTDDFATTRINAPIVTVKTMMVVIKYTAYLYKWNIGYFHV